MTETSVFSVPPPPPTDERWRERAVVRRLLWSMPVFTLAWLTMLTLVVAGMWSVRLWEIAPGTAEAVADRMSFDDEARVQATIDETDGDILFVTAFGSKLTALEAVLGWWDPDVDVLTFEERFGGSTPARQRVVNTQAMTSSRQIAEYVAFTRIGLPTSITDGAIIVEDVVCRGEDDPMSACKVLSPGDTLLTLDGQRIDTLADLSRIIGNYQPGAVVTLEIIPHRESATAEREIRLIADPDDPQRTLIGIWPADTRRVETPFAVTIDTDEIGGPSAGLAFTLALIDALSPGDLTGTQRVVATGTIDVDENVGAVGAIRQKAVAARAAGATLFLVPQAQSEDDIAQARAIGGSVMRVVTVATLQDALDELADNGGSVLL